MPTSPIEHAIFIFDQLAECDGRLNVPAGQTTICDSWIDLCVASGIMSPGYARDMRALIGFCSDSQYDTWLREKLTRVGFVDWLHVPRRGTTTIEFRWCSADGTPWHGGPIDRRDFLRLLAKVERRAISTEAEWRAEFARVDSVVSSARQ